MGYAVTPGRNAGLDTLRAAAILLVFMYHYMVFVSHAPTFGWASEVGWVGVDLFFVLSGYLIGHQLLGGLLRDRKLTLPAFYARRALRTWPAFWVVLAAYWCLPDLLGGREPPALWRFLTFTQNLGLMPGTAFSHAWSLCIEEQFYLVLPLVLLAVLRVAAGSRHRVAGLWACLGLLMVVGIGARAWLWQRYGLEADGQVDGYYPNIYYATLCRFDEFLPGVAVALLRHGHPALWERLMRHGAALFAAGLACTALMLWLALDFLYIDGYGYGHFMTVYGYSLLAVAFAILVLAALSPASWLSGARIPGAATLAVWSYSLYLTHKPVAHVVQGALSAWELPSAALLALVTVACLAAGAALYSLVERPFITLRDRRVPPNFPAAMPATAGLAA